MTVFNASSTTESVRGMVLDMVQQGLRV